MNSTTGDFSEIKRSCLTDELYVRGTQSCVKKLPYVPRKLMNLKPLNLNGIKKEIEESLEKQEQQENHKSLINSTQVDEQNESMCEESQNFVLVDERKELLRASGKHQNEYTLTDKSNYIEAVKYQSEDNKIPIKCHDNNKTSMNVIPVGKENKLVHCYQKNDSFDFDFSALSLETPAKEKVKSCNVSNNIKLECTRKERFDEFLTPKVNMIKIKNNLLEKTYLRAPVDYYNNPVTSSVINKPIFPQKVSPNLTSENELTQKAEEKLEFVWSANLNNAFKKIKVKNVEYIVLNLLGKGGSSEVFHCYNPDNKYHVAIKCVSLENATSANSYINEVKLLQQLQGCDKIVKMYDYEVLDSDKKLLVVLEKGGEDLSTILKRLACQRSHIPMYKLLFYWMEMLYAVQQIHSHGIIHSDLKPANFLKADGGLKLIDFGIASSVQTDMTSIIKSVPEGSLNYISPEALNNDSAENLNNQNFSNLKSCAKYKLHYKSDVWSLGCILYQLVYRRTPFQHISQLWSKLAAIMNPDSKIDYPVVDWVSPRLMNTIQKCLQYNIKLRPSVDELITEYEEIFRNV